jgi:hypothetical protein
LRWLSYGSVPLALLGAASYWWVPLGMVLSLAGFMIGFVDWTAARRRSLDCRMAVVGMTLCAAALAFDCAIAYLGLQTITFGGS